MNSVLCPNYPGSHICSFLSSYYLGTFWHIYLLLMLLVLLKPICADVQEEKLHSCVAPEHQMWCLSAQLFDEAMGIDCVLPDHGTTVVIALVVLPAIFFGLPSDKKMVWNLVSCPFRMFPCLQFTQTIWCVDLSLQPQHQKVASSWSKELFLFPG
jgi:hypothetical protein